MKTPPQRIAASVLILLVLAAAVAWWLQSNRSVTKPAATPETPAVSTTATVAKTKPPTAFDDVAADPAIRAAFEQCGNALQEAIRERAGQLAGRQDATSQLAYALTASMSQAPPSNSSQADAARMAEDVQGAASRAFVRAAQLDPGNPDITWLAAEQCVEGDACEAVREALLRDEPDNMAAWLRAMAWARNRGDTAAVEAAFSRAASATRYDPHRGSGLLAIMEGYAGFPTPSACEDPGIQALMRKELNGARAFDASTIVALIGIASEMASSMSFYNLTKFCKTQSPDMQETDRRADCVRIYSSMAEDQSPLERSVAMSQLIALTGETPAGLQWRERYRDLRWMIEQAGQLDAQPDVVAIATGEVAAMETALRAEGRWPPPANWLPSDEHARSLIQTGHPPPPGIR